MKIQTEQKSNYILIDLGGEVLDRNSANQILIKIQSSQSEDINSFIVSLSKVHHIDANASNILLDIHNYVYQKGGSLVFSEPNEVCLQQLKKEQLHLSLNICPTFIEAIDIINMEILERDLLNEM